MSVALHGNLRDFGIGEVFQLIGQQRKTGVLEVEGGGDTLCVVFDEGSVVSAAAEGPAEHSALGDLLVRGGLLSPERLVEVEREAASSGDSFQRLLVKRTELSVPQIRETQELLTQETIFALLRRRSGSFHFKAGAVRHSRERTRLLPAEEILMDGLRMLDEWAALDPDATREDSVFQRCGDFSAYEEWASSESPQRRAAAERVFVSVDGCTPSRRLIDLSRVGTFEGARLLTSLRRAGVIEPVDPTTLPRMRRSGRAYAQLARAGAARVGTFAPFVLLLVWAVLAGREPAPRAAEGSFSVPRASLATLRAAHATDGLRNLVEAHGFVAGDPPQDLQELVRRGWLAEDALATDPSDPYYYAVVGAGAVVLAPAQQANR